jgi:GMP synthase (glutamine-hydrolysing)
MRRISIITNGPGVSEVKSLYGQASDWIQNVLSSYDDLEVNVVKGYKMEHLDPNDDDAWIITGSAHSVYDDFPWMNYIKEKLKEAEEVRIPVLGICFGHQLIADTFGGKVVLNEKGWEVGSCTVNLLDSGEKCSLFSSFKDSIDVYQSHQDIVVEIPEKAILLAENSMGIQSFVYDDIFYGVQFHPEFTKDVMEKYLTIRYEKGILKEIPKVNECKQSSKILNNFIDNIVK